MRLSDGGREEVGGADGLSTRWARGSQATVSEFVRRDVRTSARGEQAQTYW